jgi:hypothetical protein
MNNYTKHAEHEFKAAGWVDADGKYSDGMQEMICKQVLALLDLFADHGHSGSSAPYALNLFTTLAKFQPVGPLTGEDSEWNEVGDGVFQNNRCSTVFKHPDRFDGQAYELDAIVFYDEYTDEEGEVRKSYFTNRNSMQPITFPYVVDDSKRQYVKNPEAENKDES